MTGRAVSRDFPKSPCSTSPMYIPNCTTSGRSSPISSRVASYSAFEARSPTTAMTGSIGMTRPITNVTNSSPINVVTMVARVPSVFHSITTPRRSCYLVTFQ